MVSAANAETLRLYLSPYETGIGRQAGVFVCTLTSVVRDDELQDVDPVPGGRLVHRGASSRVPDRQAARVREEQPREVLEVPALCRLQPEAGHEREERA